jgi:hypothetical protein
MGTWANHLMDAFALSLCATLISNPAPAAAGGSARIRVKGSVRIDAHVGKSSGKVVLTGSVADEAAGPVPHLGVSVSLLRKLNGAALDVPLFSASPDGCGNAGARPLALSADRLLRADRLLLSTDDEGRFCVRFALPADQFIAHIDVPPTELLEGASREITFDSALATISLRFDPEPRLLSLDGSTTTIGVVASPDEDGAMDAAGGVPLQLSNETGAVIDRASTDASGRARFTVPSFRLGLPGSGELRVTFAGSPTAAASTARATVERSTRVSLVVPRAIDGLLPASGDETLMLEVRAVAACKEHGCRSVPTGAVEAFAGDTLIGAAMLSHAEAQIVAPLPTAPSGEATLRLQYLPDAPWFIRTTDLRLTQPIRGLSWSEEVAMTLSGLAMVAWSLLVRIRARKRLLEPKRAAQEPTPGVRVVNAAASSSGWTGRVVDVYDGTAVAGARVRIERPGFERAAVVVETMSAATGEFRLPDAAAQPGDQLTVESPLYATLRRNLPNPGDLEVSMLLRRRQLLDRLVSWARMRGGRFDARPEPTPGHVRRAASSEESQIAAWADLVECTVYGGNVVDARAQADVEQIAPSDGKADR